MNPLREMFLHHDWATRTLFDRCRALPAADLQQTVPGTYGTILGTLVHLVSGDQLYLELMTGKPEMAPIRGEVSHRSPCSRRPSSWDRPAGKP